MHKLAVALILILITGNLTRVKAEQDKASMKLETNARKKPGKKVKVKTLTWNEITQKILKEGENRTFKGEVPKNLGFLEENHTRDITVQAVDSEDGWVHQVFIPVEKAENKEKPLAIIFLKKKKDHEKLISESHYLKLNILGKLEVAFSRNGKYSEDMKPIPGSAKDSFPDIDSPSVKEGLEREMDFWLKGMYRKSAAGETETSEESAEPKVTDKAPAKPANTSNPNQPKP